MPVFTDIITTLEAKIDAMTTPTYNFNYDNVNEYKPANKTYPNVKIHFPDEDKNPDAEIIDGYWSDVPIEFEVMVDDTESVVRTAIDKVIEDFKRLFQEEFFTLQCTGLLNGDFDSAEREYTHVRQRPAIVTMTFNFEYRVKRSDPSLTT